MCHHEIIYSILKCKSFTIVNTNQYSYSQYHKYKLVFEFGAVALSPGASCEIELYKYIARLVKSNIRAHEWYTSISAI